MHTAVSRAARVHGRIPRVLCPYCDGGIPRRVTPHAAADIQYVAGHRTLDFCGQTLKHSLEFGPNSFNQQIHYVALLDESTFAIIVIHLLRAKSRVMANESIESC